METPVSLSVYSAHNRIYESCTIQYQPLSHLVSIARNASYQNVALLSFSVEEMPISSLHFRILFEAPPFTCLVFQANSELQRHEIVTFLRHESHKLRVKDPTSDHGYIEAISKSEPETLKLPEVSVMKRFGEFVRGGSPQMRSKFYAKSRAKAQKAPLKRCISIDSLESSIRSQKMSSLSSRIMGLLDSQRSLEESFSKERKLVQAEVEDLTSRYQMLLKDNGMLVDLICQMISLSHNLTPVISSDDFRISYPFLQEEYMHFLRQVEKMNSKVHSKFLETNYGFVSKKQMPVFSELNRKENEKEWQNILKSGMNVKLSTLKALTRCGIPDEYRQAIWLYNINVELNKRNLRKNVKYASLCTPEKIQTASEACLRVIDCDVSRCLIDNVIFESSEKRDQLSRVLRTFAAFNKEVGYCQSMCRIAAFSLLFLSEEQSFWLLVAVVMGLLPPDYFCAPMNSARVDQKILKDLIRVKLPAIHRHMSDLDVDIQGFSLCWFHSLFVECFAPDIITRLWDTFLLEGRKVIFRFSLAILKMKQTEILECTDDTEMLCLLSKLKDSEFEIGKLCRIAFSEMNPLSTKWIDQTTDAYYRELTAKTEVESGAHQRISMFSSNLIRA